MAHEESCDGGVETAPDGEVDDCCEARDGSEAEDCWISDVVKPLVDGVCSVVETMCKPLPVVVT